MMRTIVRLAIAVLIALTLGSIFLAENALYVPKGSESGAQGRPGGPRYKIAQVRAADGALLDAWLLTPAHPNRGAVILLHGIGDTRMGVLSQAKFLLADGYTVLAPDSRAHGTSGGKLVTYGLLESDDVPRWAGYVFGLPGTDRLYGAGQSTGAAILIQSLAVEPRFRGIVADCVFASFEEVAYDRLAQNGVRGVLFSWPAIHIGMLYARVRYGLDLRHASPSEVLCNSRVPVLLIHGTADTNIPIRHSRQLHALYPATTELWEVAGAEHVESVSRAPEAYARRVTEFFAAH